MPTVRQQRGRLAEDIAVAWLAERQWRVLGRNVMVGAHDEIDIVAIDPGPPLELVCVEVRSARSPAFGAPEERLDRRKVASLYRAMRSLETTESLPRRVDLVVVDSRTGTPKIRHLRGVRAD